MKFFRFFLCFFLRLLSFAFSDAATAAIDIGQAYEQSQTTLSFSISKGVISYDTSSKNPRIQQWEAELACHQDRVAVGKAVFRNLLTITADVDSDVSLQTIGDLVWYITSCLMHQKAWFQ